MGKQLPWKYPCCKTGILITIEVFGKYDTGNHRACSLWQVRSLPGQIIARTVHKLKDLLLLVVLVHKCFLNNDFDFLNFFIGQRFKVFYNPYSVNHPYLINGNPAFYRFMPDFNPGWIWPWTGGNFLLNAYSKKISV